LTAREADRRQNEIQEQLAKTTEELSAKNKEIASLEGRLQTTRQELAEVQSSVAEARQKLLETPSQPNQSLFPRRSKGRRALPSPGCTCGEPHDAVVEDP
jgi:chromosome segregation ATPase